MRNSRFSLRSRASSSRSSCISPLRPFVRSACARVTQRLSADGVRSSSRATAPTVLRSSNTNGTAPVLNSSVKRRRARLPTLCDPILDIIATFRKLSTESGQAQAGWVPRPGPPMAAGSPTWGSAGMTDITRFG